MWVISIDIEYSSNLKFFLIIYKHFITAIAQFRLKLKKVEKTNRPGMT